MSDLESPAAPLSAVLRPLRSLVHRTRWITLRLRSLGRVEAVERPLVAARVRVLPHVRVRLGRDVALGRHMYVETDLEVGDAVLFSGYVAVVGNVHPLDTAGTVFASVPKPADRVVLEGDNLVGYGAILIAPCHLEHGAVVGAGAVVTGRLDADTIYTGVPGRPKRRRRRSDPSE